MVVGSIDDGGVCEKKSCKDKRIDRGNFQTVRKICAGEQMVLVIQPGEMAKGADPLAESIFSLCGDSPFSRETGKFKDC